MEYNITKRQDFGEAFLVTLFFILGLLPVRLIYVTYISTHWAGSIALICGITVTVIILSHKNKLGFFGRAFLRQLTKVHRGKRKYLFYTQTVIISYFFIMAFIAVEYGNTNLKYEKQKIIDLLPNEQKEMITNPEKPASIKQLNEEFKKYPPEELLRGMLAMFLMPIFAFEQYALLVAIINDISNNFFAHFVHVAIVELFVGLGVMVYFKRRSMKIGNLHQE